MKLADPFSFLSPTMKVILLIILFPWSLILLIVAYLIVALIQIPYYFLKHTEDEQVLSEEQREN